MVLVQIHDPRHASYGSPIKILFIATLCETNTQLTCNDNGAAADPFEPDDLLDGLYAYLSQGRAGSLVTVVTGATRGHRHTRGSYA